MSRHTIVATDPRYEVVCGWDNPLATFFAQVWDVAVPPGTADEEACVLWVGLTRRVETVAALPAALADYVTLPAALVAQREAERAQADPHRRRPRRLVRRREALAPQGPRPAGRRAERRGHIPLAAEPAEPPHDSARAVTTAQHAPCVVTAPRWPGKSRHNKRIDT